MTGAKVREIRKRLGYSQSTLATLLGYNRLQTVSEIESGKHELKRPQLIILTHIVIVEGLKTALAKAQELNHQMKKDLEQLEIRLEIKTHRK